MLRPEDRVFLTDFASYICYTHPIAALALYRAAADADEVGVVSESLMRGIGREAAVAKATTDRTAALVQTHVVARLLGQLAASIEDCGGLGEAIRYRDRSGLFTRYLSSKAGAVGTFWDLVVATTPITDLLAVPDLGTISLSAEDRREVAASYDALSQALTDIAGLIRGKASPGALAVGADAANPDVVAIVTEILPTAEAAGAQPGMSIIDAYNKIKHRFTVVEHVEDLGREVDKRGGSVIVGTYPRDSAHAERLLRNGVMVARTAGEMAALILRLDELGVLPAGR